MNDPTRDLYPLNKAVVVSPDYGEYCIRLANALADEVDVLLLIPRQLAAPHRDKVRPTVRVALFHKPRLRQPIHQLRATWFIVRQIRAFCPDVIHLQQGHLYLNPALPLMGRCALVVTVHDPRQHYGDQGGHKTPQFVFDYGFRRAHRLIVHAQQSRQILVDEVHLPPERIHVIPHIRIGVDDVEPLYPEDDHLILFWGRIWPYKGLDYLIRAEPLITAQLPEARIMIAGQGEDFARYRAMMVHPEKFVVHNEYIPDTRAVEYFQRASVVVLPYLEASQSGVVPVAYTFAKPVIVTSVGGLPEAVEHERTGLLVPPRDEHALAEAIVRLLRDPALRHTLGANGKRKIDSECSPPVIARQTLEVYRQALSAAHSNGRGRHG